MSGSDEELAAWLRPLLEADLKHWRDREAAYLPNVEREGEWLWHQARGHADRAATALAILDLHQPVAALGDLPADALTCIRNWEECQECGPNNDRPAILAAPGLGETFYPCRTVRLLASGYRHQPGYRKEWAPDRA
jgi:hypothetical protein